MKVSANPRSRKQIREIAKSIRQQLKLENEFTFPIVSVIELLAADDEEDFEFEVVPDNEMLETYGTTNTKDNIMRIQQNVYNGAVKGNPRDRFTLCHEFGHWLLHQPGSISFARGEIPTYCNPEWQANTFAAELMIPAEIVRGMSIDEIVEGCGVSRMCAEIQVEHIK